jgi:hypothetical protein
LAHDVRGSSLSDRSIAFRPRVGLLNDNGKEHMMEHYHSHDGQEAKEEKERDRGPPTPFKGTPSMT